MTTISFAFHFVFYFVDKNGNDLKVKHNKFYTKSDAYQYAKLLLANDMMGTDHIEITCVSLDMYREILK